MSKTKDVEPNTPNNLLISSLVISSIATYPVYNATSLLLKDISGVGELRARSENKGPWRIDGDAALGGQTIGGVSISGLNAAFGGDYQDDRLSGVVDFDAGVTRAAIGRLRIDDMPARGRANLAIDLAAKSLTASPVDGSCAAIARAAFRMAEQDMDARLSDASLCASGAPLLAVRWGDSSLVRMEGALNARVAHYRLGKTNFDGAPPRIDFALDYDPAAQLSRMTGDFAGGRVLLNNALVLYVVVSTDTEYADDDCLHQINAGNEIHEALCHTGVGTVKQHEAGFVWNQVRRLGEPGLWQPVDYRDLDTLPADLSNAPGISTPNQAAAQPGSLQDAIVKHRWRCRKALGMDEVLK